MRWPARLFRNFIHASPMTDPARSVFGALAAPPAKRRTPSRWPCARRCPRQIRPAPAMVRRTVPAMATVTATSHPVETAASSENGIPPGAQATRDWSIHIVGSDLLPSAIEVAERGLYPQSSLTGLPPAAIRACFSKIGSPQRECQRIAGSAAKRERNGNGNGSSNGAHLLVKPRLRSMVTFNTMNLTKPVYIGRFDCIFCMDVLPHLSRAQRTAPMERLHLLSRTRRISFPQPDREALCPKLELPV